MGVVHELMVNNFILYQVAEKEEDKEYYDEALFDLYFMNL